MRNYSCKEYQQVKECVYRKVKADLLGMVDSVGVCVNNPSVGIATMIPVQRVAHTLPVCANPQEPDCFDRALLDRLTPVGLRFFVDPYFGVSVDESGISELEHVD